MVLVQGHPRTVPKTGPSGPLSYGGGLRALLPTLCPCTPVGRSLREVAGRSCQWSLQGGPFFGPPWWGGPWVSGGVFLIHMLWMGPWGCRH